MIKYNRYSLALNDEENERFLEAERVHGAGVKKIFMATLNALVPKKEVVIEEE